ncbi:hypothetical protein BaRGS_00014209 [Batillaria attramentaria]|uniref:Uncharacterized protein n=1 Tax=Batillaria attramentaria TaxID=370345 RepID=A0ABD0L5N3_9CAEN
MVAASTSSCPQAVAVSAKSVLTMSVQLRYACSVPNPTNEGPLFLVVVCAVCVSAVCRHRLTPESRLGDFQSHASSLCVTVVFAVLNALNRRFGLASNTPHTFCCKSDYLPT